jgi:hypothetical protein
MSDVWYYADRNGQVGPLRLRELKATLATHDSTQQLFVWCDRFPDWKRVEDVSELSENTRTPPPPPPKSPAAILIKCPDCGKDVSPSAPTCPFCGSPVKKKLDQKKANLGCLLLLSPFIVIGFMFFTWYLGLSPEEKAALEKERQEKDMTVEACVFSQKIAKAHLKAPTTAEFPNCYGSDLNEYSIRANPENDTIIVDGYVDAQNGFGAKIRTRFEATMSRTGLSENIIWREVKFSFK